MSFSYTGVYAENTYYGRQVMRIVSKLRTDYPLRSAAQETDLVSWRDVVTLKEGQCTARNFADWVRRKAKY